jgi:hypothetical protein
VAVVIGEDVVGALVVVLGADETGDVLVVSGDGEVGIPVQGVPDA